MWRRLFGREAIPVPKPRFARPKLENLEDRLAPAAYDWTGAGATALASDPANWAQNAAPSSTSDFLNFSGVAPPPMPPMPGMPAPPVANPTKSVIFDAASPSVFASISFAAQYTGGATFAQSVSVLTLSVAGQTLTVNAGETLDIGFASLNNSTLQGSGAVAVGGVFAQALLMPAPMPGWMSLSGTTQITVANFTVDATSQVWIGGDLTVRTPVLTNEGSIFWSSGAINLPLSFLENDGLFEITTTTPSITGGTILDDGMIVVDPGSMTILNLPSDLTIFGGGSLIVRSGRVNLAGTVQDGGTVEIDNGAILDVVRSAVTGGTADIVGEGTLTVNGTLVALANTRLDVAPAVVLATGGIIEGWGSFLFATSLTVGSGSFLNTSVFANNVTLRAVAVLTPIELTNSQLTMAGLSVWSGGEIDMIGSTLENTSIFSDETSSPLVDQGRTSEFLNDATARYEKNATDAAGVSSFGAAFWNSGTFDLNGFTRTFTNGFYQSAGTVSLDGGTLGLSPNQSDGSYWLLGGLLIAGGGTISGGDLTNMGGTLDVSLGLTLLGNYDQWAGGTLIFNPSCLPYSPVMEVTGFAQISGTLAIDLLFAATPDSGTEASLLGAVGGYLGAFTTIPDGWSINYGLNISLEKN